MFMFEYSVFLALNPIRIVKEENACFSFLVIYPM